MISLHETCQQYVARRLSEGWKVVWQSGYHLILSSPDGNTLRPVDLRNDVETLRPNAAGDVTQLTPLSGTNFSNVDEVEADEDTTYVVNQTDATDKYDLYNLPAHSVGSGTINFIKVYIRVRCLTYNDYGYSRTKIKTGGTEYNGVSAYLINSYVTRNTQYSINPKTTVAWTWDDIDALQIGVRLDKDTYDARCTQVYVEVDYTPAAGLQSKSANMAAKLMAAGVI